LAEPGASPDAWTGRYEDLRRRVTEEAGRLPRGLEVAVFVRQGVAAWMQVWTEETSRPMSRPVVHEPMPLPAGLYADVTRLLVNMLLDHRQETLA
jgi:hypothetical protein